MSGHSKSSIVVVGSLVLDHVVRVARFPVAGESLPATGFATYPGGKGANQAVAAARLGASVAFVGKVGRDAAGETLRRALAGAGVDLEGLQEAEGSSGAALIALDPGGQNTICVALGANLELRAENVPSLSADAVLAQLETDPSAALGAMSLDAHVRILNPAPPRDVPEAIWSLATVVTPNEHECAHFTGIEPTDAASAERAAAWFRDRGAAQVAITLGARGVWCAEAGLLPAFPVEAVDTVGAGDAFNGALAVALAEGQGFGEACRFASAAAALSVTKPGAQGGMPTRAQVEALIRRE